ncbi:MAG: hypothetical protein AAFU64_13530 [Bacteroidota bacterium]
MQLGKTNWICNHFLGAILGIFLYSSTAAQNNFIWSQDLDLPYQDENGKQFTGTEVIHLVPHKGKLYAGNSYWAENTDPRQGQIWVKEGVNAAWKQDFEMPPLHSRVPSLYSFIFQKDYAGNNIAPDTILFAGATRDYGAENDQGTATVFIRDDSQKQWIQHDFPQVSDHEFGYTQVRSMGFHRDKLVGNQGVDLVFAGASLAPTGIYRGRYDPASPGKIRWDAQPEFTPSGFQRIMGFAVVNDTLYMATQREIFKRIDGPNPGERWVQVLSLTDPDLVDQYGQGLYDLWIQEEDIRGLRSIEDPFGEGEVLMFGGLNHLFRLDPKNNYQLTAEVDMEEVLELATQHDFQYIQSQLIQDYTNPVTQEKVEGTMVRTRARLSG